MQKVLYNQNFNDLKSHSQKSNSTYMHNCIVENCMCIRLTEDVTRLLKVYNMSWKPCML